MATPEFDPLDVLEKYVSLLSKPGSSVIRDVSELSHPKDTIRYVLQHCIKTAEEGEARNFLRNAYMALANFQQMSDAEREATAVLSEVGAPAPEGSEQFKAQARRITHIAGPLQAVLDRLKAEMAVLSQDLSSLPGAAEPPQTG